MKIISIFFIIYEVNEKSNLIKKSTSKLKEFEFAKKTIGLKQNINLESFYSLVIVR